MNIRPLPVSGHSASRYAWMSAPTPGSSGTRRSRLPLPVTCTHLPPMSASATRSRASAPRSPGPARSGSCPAAPRPPAGPAPTAAAAVPSAAAPTGPPAGEVREHAVALAGRYPACLPPFRHWVRSIRVPHGPEREHSRDRGQPVVDRGRRVLVKPPPGQGHDVRAGTARHPGLPAGRAEALRELAEQVAHDVRCGRVFLVEDLHVTGRGGEVAVAQSVAHFLDVHTLID